GGIQPGEDCDGADVGGATCVSLGFGGGTLACGADCAFDTSQCGPERCGDGLVGPDEQCDPPSFGGATCASLGFPAGGSLACAPNCSAVTGRDRLSLRAEFAIPSAFGTLHPATAGMSLLVGDDAGGDQLALTLPPGAPWSERRGR